jgi:hypothetical protein
MAIESEEKAGSSENRKRNGMWRRRRRNNIIWRSQHQRNQRGASQKHGGINASISAYRKIDSV